MARISCRSYTGGVTDNFFRPYPGYNNVAWTDNAYNSNYHALLLSINRRFSNGLQFGFSYTFSKFMDYTGIPIYQPLRTWSYGFDSSDQTHNAVLNFTYNLPKPSRMLNDNKVVKWVFDDWTLAGIAQWVSGTPATISLSTVQGTDLTGGGDGQRVNVVGNPNSTRLPLSTSGSTRRRSRRPARATRATRQRTACAIRASTMRTSRSPSVSPEERKARLHAPLGGLQRVQPHAVLGPQRVAEI